MPEMDKESLESNSRDGDRDETITGDMNSRRGSRDGNSRHQSPNQSPVSIGVSSPPPSPSGSLNSSGRGSKGGPSPTSSPVSMMSPTGSQHSNHSSNGTPSQSHSPSNRKAHHHHLHSHHLHKRHQEQHHDNYRRDRDPCQEMRRSSDRDRSPLLHDSLSSTVASGINNRSPSPSSFCCPPSLPTASSVSSSSSVNASVMSPMRSVFPGSSSFYPNRLLSSNPSPAGMTGRLSPSQLSSFYGTSAFTPGSAYAAAASLFGRSGGSSFPLGGHHPHHPLLHASSTGSPGGGGGGSIGSSSSSSSPASHPHASLLTSGHHIHHPSGNTLLHPGHHPHGSSLSNPSTAAAVAHAYATQMMFNSSSLSQASAFSQALAAASLPPSFSSSNPIVSTANGGSMSAAAAAFRQAWLSSAVNSSTSPLLSPRMTRSPGQSLPSGSEPGQRRCPLCGVTLEASELKAHFFEEVHKTEMLRSTLRLSDWNENKDNSNSNGLSSSHRSLNVEGGGLSEHRQHHQHPHHPFHQDDASSPCKRPRFSGDKMQPCSRWQTYQRVRQNRQSRFSGLLRCKRTSIDSLSGSTTVTGDKQHHPENKESPPASLTSVTSSPQASPLNSNHTSITTNNNSNSHRDHRDHRDIRTSSNINNNNLSCKSNGQSRGIWSIVGDIEEQRDILKRDRDLDLSRTIIQEDHFNLKRSPRTTFVDQHSSSPGTPNIEVVSCN